MNDADREVLNLFCNKVQELLDSRFSRDAIAGGVGYSMKWKRGGPLDHDRRGPDEEAVKAFLLTLRFFLQDNDSISIRNMDKRISKSVARQNLKEGFSNARAELNQFLDSPGPIAVNINGLFLTRRDILYTFLYGTYAHTTDKHAKRLQEWKTFHADVLLRSEFDNIVLTLVQALYRMRTIVCEIVQDS